MSKEIQKVTENKDVGLTKHWEDKLAQYAVEAKEFVDSVDEPGMKFFSTKGAKLKWNDERINDDTLICVILTHCFENTFYPSEFSSDDKSPPPCFSLGMDGESLKPHENCEEPQNEACKDCPNLEWSSGKGKAKACSNKYRLALLPAGSYIPDDNPELITNPKEYSKNKIGYLRIPPTSLINYTKYVSLLRSKNKPPFAMFTEIKIVEDEKTILKINFKPIKPIQDVSILEALELRVEEATKEILTPYEKLEDTETEDKPTKY